MGGGDTSLRSGHRPRRASFYRTPAEAEIHGMLFFGEHLPAEYLIEFKGVEAAPSGAFLCGLFSPHNRI